MPKGKILMGKKAPAPMKRGRGPVVGKPVKPAPKGGKKAVGKPKVSRSGDTMSGYNYGTKQGPGFTGGSKPVYTRPNEGGTVSQYRPQLEKGSLGRFGYDNYLEDNNAYGTEMKNGSGTGIIGRGDPIWKRDIIEKRNVDYTTFKRTGGGKGSRKTSKGGK